MNRRKDRLAPHPPRGDTPEKIGPIVVSMHNVRPFHPQPSSQFRHSLDTVRTLHRNLVDPDPMLRQPENRPDRVAEHTHAKSVPIKICGQIRHISLRASHRVSGEDVCDLYHRVWAWFNQRSLGVTLR